jgi:hypothetical protein
MFGIKSSGKSYISFAISLCLPVSLHVTVFVEFDIGLFYHNLPAHFQFWLKLYNSNGHFT